MGGIVGLTVERFDARVGCGMYIVFTEKNGSIGFGGREGCSNTRILNVSGDIDSFLGKMITEYTEYLEVSKSGAITIKQSFWFGVRLLHVTWQIDRFEKTLWRVDYE